MEFELNLSEMFTELLMKWCVVGNTENEWQQFRTNLFGMMETCGKITVLVNSSLPTYQVNFTDGSILKFEFSVENCYISIVKE